MSEKIFNTRIQHKHDIEANWLKATNFVPKAGELIVYDPDENFSYARTKMGDGITNVNDLSFMNDVFWAVANVTSPYAIYEAHQLGKQCYAIRNSALSSGSPVYEIYKLEHIAIQQEMPIAYFSHRSGRIMDWCSVTPTGNPERGYWDFSSDTYISTKEKVNSIDETSTNSTFPSTKAVYDFMVENHTWESLPDKPFGEENIQHTIELNETIGDDFPLTCVYTVDGENKIYEVNENNSYGPNHDFKVYEPLSKEEIRSMVVSLGEVDIPLTDSDIIIENENFIISEIFTNILIDNCTVELGNKEYLYPKKGFYVSPSLFGLSVKFTWHEVSIVQIDSKYIKDDIARVSQIPTGALADKDIVSKEDLDSSVQQSLDKADTAFQSSSYVNTELSEWTEQMCEEAYADFQNGKAVIGKIWKDRSDNCQVICISAGWNNYESCYYLNFIRDNVYGNQELYSLYFGGLYTVYYVEKGERPYVPSSPTEGYVLTGTGTGVQWKELTKIEAMTEAEIDEICNATIYAASEVLI